MTAPFTWAQHDVHRQILKRELSKAVAEGVHGVLLCGSVARGTASPASDLDLQLSWPEARPFTVSESQGVLIERHGRTLAQESELIERADLHLYAWTEGRILHDPGGELARLQARAQTMLADYRTPEWEARALRHWLVSSLSKLDSLQGGLQAAFLVQTTLWKLAEGLCAVNNRPSPPFTLMWEMLPTLPEQPHHWLNTVLLGQAEDRLNTFRRVAVWLVERLDSPRLKRIIHPGGNP